MGPEVVWRKSEDSCFHNCFPVNPSNAKYEKCSNSEDDKIGSPSPFSLNSSPTTLLECLCLMFPKKILG